MFFTLLDDYLFLQDGLLAKERTQQKGCGIDGWSLPTYSGLHN
jgi:hypothetical protein